MFGGGADLLVARHSPHKTTCRNLNISSIRERQGERDMHTNIDIYIYGVNSNCNFWLPSFLNFFPGIIYTVMDEIQSPPPLVFPQLRTIHE